MANKKANRPADVNKRAKAILDIATNEVQDTTLLQDELKSAAAILGRKGGLKGGNARAAKLTPKRRAEIAKKAATERWKNHEKDTK